MIWALKNSEKIEATPDTRAICPLCSQEVLSKCGEINKWHWVHVKKESCDSWYESETDWHYHWKMTFGKENAEVIIRKENEYHIADIMTLNNVVIELQNSPIQKKVIAQREEFYGKKLIWLINGEKFAQNFSTYNEEYEDYLWNNEDSKPKKKILRKSFLATEWSFDWKYNRKTWKEVKRPVFIDFGDEDLFWVKEGMGKYWGEGIWVAKEMFIRKYGGSVEYLRKTCLLQRRTNESETIK
ncbi:competence protein CoiA family protein [Salinimicrobium sp. TIG7-5_MAKvit]|uniref:competence protein CoiA family protein n=1 Tax=Salinimicrobium sp. TIG7-5_MAKvit TaxID=3121289 RepID=UPI003C6DCA19